MKRIFTDEDVINTLKSKGIEMSSANSINWGRLAPQIAYYVSAYCDLVDAEEISLGDEVEFVVPTGNFGDVLAGYYAYRMGLPVKKFIIASNANNVLTDFSIRECTMQSAIFTKRCRRLWTFSCRAILKD